MPVSRVAQAAVALVYKLVISYGVYQLDEPLPLVDVERVAVFLTCVAVKLGKHCLEPL